MNKTTNKKERRTKVKTHRVIILSALSLFLFLFLVNFISASDFGYNYLDNQKVDLIYSEIWGLDIGVIPIASSNTYYNITNFTDSKLNGFSFSGGGLIAKSSGMYKVSSAYSFSGNPNQEYHLALGVNGIRIPGCHSERVIGTGGDVGSASITCLCPMEIGDNLTAMIENADSSGNPTIHSINMNLIRVGNL